MSRTVEQRKEEPMSEHPNVALARRGYEAFSSGDLEVLSELFADDAVWHQPGHTDLAGDYRGRDAVFAYFGKLLERTGGTIKVEPLDILASDDRAVCVQHTTARRNGDALDTRDVVVFEMRDGKVVEVQLYQSDPDLEDRFWA